MTTLPDSTDRPQQHRFGVVRDFLSHDVHAECSCGWVGGPVADDREALADYVAHTEGAYAMLTRPTPSDHAGCGEWLREQFAAKGVDATVTTARPLVKTPYDQTPFRCPHGVAFYHAPTSEQIAAWARDGVA